MDKMELSDEKKKILQEFKINLKDVLQPQHDDRLLLRFLTARNFHLKNAEDMLRADIKFRQKLIQLETLNETNSLRKEMQPYLSSAFLGFSNEGHTVRFFNFGETDFKGLSRSLTTIEFIVCILTLFETDLKRLDEQNKKTSRHVETTIIVADFKDFKISHFTDRMTIKILTHLMKLYQDHYPERLKNAYLINVPKLFAIVWPVFKPFLSDIMAKIHIFESVGWQEDIFSVIPKEIIPAYLGGSLYKPEGDPYCNDILKWNMKVPPSLYLKDSCSLQITDPGVKEKIIRPRSVFHAEKYIKESGRVLCWEFETKDHDIYFGLRFISHIEEDEEELMATEKVESSVMVEKSEFICSKPGKYSLIFDNTYSWFTSKHLLYKISVKSESSRTEID